MNDDFIKNVHALNFERLKVSKFRETYYNIIFKLTGGRSNTVFGLLPYSWRRWYYEVISPIIKPQHCRLRKSIPRQWRDISSLIVTVNFEFIKSFYEDEYCKGIVNWDSDEKHQKFAKWLTQVYDYIKVERPKLEKQRDNAYPPVLPIDEMFRAIKDKNNKIEGYEFVDREKTYEELYGEVNRLEELINKKDTKILLELIKNRDFFWT
jgi:hypothetical protein